MEHIVHGSKLCGKKLRCAPK